MSDIPGFGPTWSLWDRLLGDVPSQTNQFNRHSERKLIIDSVSRDITSLLNTVAHPDYFNSDQPVATSVLAYGFPPVSGHSINMSTAKQVEKWIHQSVTRFEKRIDSATLGVILVEDKSDSHHQFLSFQITGFVKSSSGPVELSIRTQFDAENGRFAVSKIG